MSLDGTLDVTVAAGSVEFSFVVTNASSEPVELSFRSGKIADIAVLADGTERWRWSDGRMFTQALRTETLHPGDSMGHEATWMDPASGRYTAEATLEATDATLVERTDFEVP